MLSKPSHIAPATCISTACTGVSDSDGSYKPKTEYLLPKLYLRERATNKMPTCHKNGGEKLIKATANTIMAAHETIAHYSIKGLFKQSTDTAS